MSMSNASFVSGVGGGGRFGGGGNIKDILSRSIMENSMAAKANTSIMDLMTGHSAPTMKDMANRSMSILKPREHSFVSSQKSFFSKKPAGLERKNGPADNNNMLDGFSSESDCGAVKKVDAFSDENSLASDDSEDCVVENTD
jgi:hypothetical protein